MSKFDPYEHLHVIPNPDGSLTRLVEFPLVEASGDVKPSGGDSFLSKDVILDAEKKTLVRLFRPTKLPSNDNSIARLPIIIYFHTGGWIFFSVAALAVHQKCSRFATEVPAIVLAVDYRLAPENRLPAPYDDAVDTILWVKQQALDPQGEKWLRDYADFSRCYLCGSNNGANIVFHAGIRALDLEIEPLRIAGLAMNQPMFGGIKRTAAEIHNAADPLLPLPVMDKLWELALPVGANRDHRYSNPMMDCPILEKVHLLPRCLVIGFCGDINVDRQQDFVTTLVKRGVRVEARFEEVGFYAIDFIDPARAALVLNMVKDFINGHSNY